MSEPIRFIQCTETAMAHLSHADPALGRIIAHLGPIERRGDGDLFASVVRHIVGQQISTAAQTTIWTRMSEALTTIDEESITATSVEELQRFGMTFRKAGYIHSFASQVKGGTFDLEALEEMDDEQAIAELTTIKGIGRWTAEMILLFGMGRGDIVSFGDLAIIRGMKALYGLEEVDREHFDSLRSRYSPYGTAASLYLWAVSKMEMSQLSALL